MTRIVHNLYKSRVMRNKVAAALYNLKQYSHMYYNFVSHSFFK